LEVIESSLSMLVRFAWMLPFLNPPLDADKAFALLFLEFNANVSHEKNASTCRQAS